MCFPGYVGDTAGVGGGGAEDRAVYWTLALLHAPVRAILSEALMDCKSHRKALIFLLSPQSHPPPHWPLCALAVFQKVEWAPFNQCLGPQFPRCIEPTAKLLLSDEKPDIEKDRNPDRSNQEDLCFCTETTDGPKGW